VVISAAGDFLYGRTKVLNGKDCPTLIPATESSAGRSGAKVAPHPLCEEIGYCASDYPKTEKEKSQAYLFQMKQWADSENSHPKLRAIHNYLRKGRLWSDLEKEMDFPITVVKQDGKTKEKVAIEKTFVRWRVEEFGNPVSGTWEDHNLIEAWIAHDAKVNSQQGFCFVNGREERIALNHPRFIRWPGDGAKLISSNDHSGFTFRGRFTDSKTSMEKEGVQTASIGFLPTQKAHNALRWLINNQGYRNDEQIYVAWAVSGKPIPDPLKSSFDLLEEPLVFEEVVDEPEGKINHAVNLGATFAHKFNNYLRGYATKLEPNEQIIVMGLDSATPGRMSVIYYRELLASEFFERLKSWHLQFAWPQRHSIETETCGNGKNAKKKTIWPVSSPVPRVIAEAAYGDVLKSSETLKKNLIERIMPAIVDGQSFPRDIMESASRKASNRNNCEPWEWERNLGVACALYRGFYQRHPDKQQRREYSMTVEESRTTRDYLYGRLLAIAERIEEVALSVGGESRPTTAARLMQRYADRPFSTWRNIELALQPYMQRLQSSRTGFLTNRKKDLDTVMCLFKDGEFEQDKALSGEFLLGFHCQRMSYRQQSTEEITVSEKGE